MRYVLLELEWMFGDDDLFVLYRRLRAYLIEMFRRFGLLDGSPLSV